MTCATCTSACCYLPNGECVLTLADLTRLRAALGEPWLAANVWLVVPLAMRAMAEGPDGVVGFLGKKAIASVVGHEPLSPLGCIALEADGCSIYEHRPAQCRALDPASCGQYRADPRKLDGRVHLRVML